MHAYPFCQDYAIHIRKVNDIFQSCSHSHCTAEKFEQIGYQYAVLASEARSNRMQVLASYAQAMAGFARKLFNQCTEKLDDAEKSLLQNGIELGLPCRNGEHYDQCPNQNFDRVWPLITELREHSSLT